MSGASDQRGAFAALVVGVWIALVLCVSLWLFVPSIALAVAHAVLIEAVWAAGLLACAGRGRRALAFAGAGVTVGLVFALLGVFLRGYA